MNDICNTDESGMPGNDIPEMYDILAKQVSELMREESWYVSLFANVSALIYETLADINWAGFYIVRGDRLFLGPFQGKAACIHIEKGRGVCGSAWEKDETIVVPDVHQFSGHIACDSASRSEIVIPIHCGQEVVAVLDIDSPVKERFSPDDQNGLEEIVRRIESRAQLR